MRRGSSREESNANRFEGNRAFQQTTPQASRCRRNFRRGRPSSPSAGATRGQYARRSDFRRQFRKAVFRTRYPPGVGYSPVKYQSPRWAGIAARSPSTDW